jgi:hypothetical protein
MMVFYLIHATVILLLSGLPWLLIRSRITNLDLKRALSSLVFALAFTPGVFGGDMGIVGFAPAAELLMRRLIGYFGPPILLTVGSITFGWGLIFVVRSIFAMWHKRGKNPDA